jgi:LysM repeat protein
LLGIAIRYGIEVEDILLANPGVNPQFLRIGDALVIPGPGGEPISALVPSPTPVTLLASSVDCYVSQLDDLWCVAGIESESIAVVSMTGTLALLDSQGSLITSKPVHTPLRILLPSERQPLSAVFGPPIPEYASVQLIVSGAIQVEDPESRFQHFAVDILEISKGIQSRQWKIHGVVSGVEGIELESLVVLLIALNAEGKIIGFRTVELDQEQVQERDFHFDEWVYSAGPQIHDLAVYAEGITP